MAGLPPSKEQSPALQPDSVNPVPTPLRTRDIYLRILLSPAGILLLLIFIMSFGMTNFQGMIGLYVVDKFAFNTKQVGAIWMVMGMILIVAQGGLVGPLTKKLGDFNLIKIGLLGTIGFVLVAFAVDYVTPCWHSDFYSRPCLINAELVHLNLQRASRHGHGTEQCIHQSGTRGRSALGRLYLRHQYRISLLQRRSYAAAWIAGQPVRVSQPTSGQVERFEKLYVTGRFNLS
jgi:hypothetical protein